MRAHNSLKMQCTAREQRAHKTCMWSCGVPVFRDGLRVGFVVAVVVMCVCACVCVCVVHAFRDAWTAAAAHTTKRDERRGRETRRCDNLTGRFGARKSPSSTSAMAIVNNICTQVRFCSSAYYCNGFTPVRSKRPGDDVHYVLLGNKCLSLLYDRSCVPINISDSVDWENVKWYTLNEVDFSNYQYESFVVEYIEISWLQTFMSVLIGCANGK